MSWLERVVSALAYSLCAEAASTAEPRLDPPYNDAARFTTACLERMPDHLSLGLRLFTLFFDACGVLRRGRPFHRQLAEHRAAQVARWRHSGFKPFRDLIRFHQSLAVFTLYGRLEREA